MKMKKIASMVFMFVLFVTVVGGSTVKAETLPNYTGFGDYKTISFSADGVSIFKVKLSPSFTIYNNKVLKTGQGYELVYEHPRYNVEVTYPSGASDSCIVYQISYKLKTSDTFKVAAVYGACGYGDGTIKFVKFL